MYSERREIPDRPPCVVTAMHPMLGWCPPGPVGDDASIFNCKNFHL